MASLNKVFLVGNLTREPELRYTQGGMAVATLGIASNRKFHSKTGELKEEVLYINVEVWGKLAENCGEYLSKGRPILVEGRIVMDQWEDKDGNKRTTYKISSNNIQFLGSASGSRENSAPNSGQMNENKISETPKDNDPGNSIPDDIPF